MRAGAEYFARAGGAGAAPLRGAARVLRRRARGQRGRAAVRVLAGQRASDGLASCAPAARSSSVPPSPGPKSDRARPTVSATACSQLRAQDRSVEEIAAELTLAGTPVSAQTVWTILDAEGHRAPAAPSTGPRAARRRGWPAIKARALTDWPADTSIWLRPRRPVPARARRSSSSGSHELVASCGYPSTTVLSAWHSLGVAAVAQVRADPARKPRARAR